MADQSIHPSFLELDRLRLGAARDPGAANHVRACATCRSYLDQLAVERPVPRWVTDLAARPPQAPARAATPWRWAWGLAGAVVATAAVLVVTADPRSDRPQITAKGDPAVGIYVKHQDQVSLWDGRAPVAAGDTLRLKVIPSGYGHLTVLAPTTRDGGAATLARLYEAAIDPGRESVLPVAWRVDEAAGDEELIVVLSPGPLARLVTIDDLEAARQQPAPLWSTHLILKKTNATEATR